MGLEVKSHTMLRTYSIQCQTDSNSEIFRRRFRCHWFWFGFGTLWKLQRFPRTREIKCLV